MFQIQEVGKVSLGGPLMPISHTCFLLCLEVRYLVWRFFFGNWLKSELMVRFSVTHSLEDVKSGVFVQYLFLTKKCERNLLSVP